MTTTPSTAHDGPWWLIICGVVTIAHPSCAVRARLDCFPWSGTAHDSCGVSAWTRQAHPTAYHARTPPGIGVCGVRGVRTNDLEEQNSLVRKEIRSG